MANNVCDCETCRDGEMPGKDTGQPEDRTENNGGGEKSFQCSWTGCVRVYTTPGVYYFEFYNG